MARQTDARKREVNFFASLRLMEAAKEKSGRNTKLWITFIVVLAVGIVGGSGLFMVKQIQQLDEEIATAQQYIQDEKNQAAYAERSGLWDGLTTLRAYNQACEALIAAIQTEPRVESSHFADVWNELPPFTSILAYSYTEPVLTVHCETTDKNAPALFAEQLTKSGDFVDVVYSGFASQGADASGVFTFSIQCQLWSPAEAPAA